MDSKILFTKRLTQTVKEKGLSFAELSRLSGISKARISQYVHGIYMPNSSAIVSIATALNVDPDYLLGNTNTERSTDRHSRRLKILGEVRCGEPTFAEEIYMGEISVPDHIDADFCLIAKGDSMIDARIYDGDYVFIKRRDIVENGKIGVCILDGEATLKRIYYYPEEQKLILVPENKAYAPRSFSGAELESIKILGQAIAFTSFL